MHTTSIASRRWLAGPALALTLVIGLGVQTASAAPSAKAEKGGCPAGPSTWHLTGLAEWTARSEAGLVHEFGDLTTAARIILDDATATAADITAVVQQVFGLIDANTDGQICTSDTNPGGLPDYLLNVHDNKFNAQIKR